MVKNKTKIDERDETIRIRHCLLFTDIFYIQVFKLNVSIGQIMYSYAQFCFYHLISFFQTKRKQKNPIENRILRLIVNCHHVDVLPSLF